MEHEIDFQDRPQQTILVVEDQATDQALVRKNIKDLWPDCKIVPVTSMQGAYEAFREEDFDMILLDLNLPDGYGPQSVEQMRKIDRKTPIIVITGMVTDMTVYEALKKGANHVLPKSKITDKEFTNVLEQSTTRGS